MNEILTLKGKFQQMKNGSYPGAPTLPKNGKVNTVKLESLIEDLKTMKHFWKNQTLLNNMLISAYYVKIAAKSNRLQGFFARGKETPNERIVGAKFGGSRHIITYFVSNSDVDKAIDSAIKSACVVKDVFNGEVTANSFNNTSRINNIDFKQYDIAKSTFQKFIVDAWYVERFDVEKADISTKKSAIVTLYDTGTPISVLLTQLGIKVYNERLLDHTTALLDQTSVALLIQKAPYLVAMATEDINNIAPTDFISQENKKKLTIPQPGNEPTIGVIDTLFDDQVYFHDWVDSDIVIDPDIKPQAADYTHGTAVTSILVDGPSLNPKLDDGCGRFKVKHIGVATHRKFSSFSVVKAIQKAVAENPGIHVWNLSLGSTIEVNKNFISAEGAVLDKIQFEHNVIFVVAGTNKDSFENAETKRIGAPADSINSLVVNSVAADKKPASYSRSGIVLSFFTKPDASYYGGDREHPMHAVNSNGEVCVAGTSFSAPWVARKLAYLIDVIGLSREVAKALLIDASIGWKSPKDYESLSLIGNGIIPVRIEDVLHTSDSEIKFVLEGTSELWNTYSYSLPVPVVDGKQPFNAKATICYFPKCSRNQGVDYTNTELDLYFGRIDNKSKIKPIDNNNQSEGVPGYLKEEDARKLFRKWDNVKHVSDVLKSNPRPRKAYDNPMWAISIKTKERLNNHDGENLKFGIVITLKEMNDINRIQDFIQQASLKGWLVNKIDVQNRIDVYTQAEQEIELE